MEKRSLTSLEATLPTIWLYGLFGPLLVADPTRCLTGNSYSIDFTPRVTFLLTVLWIQPIFNGINVNKVCDPTSLISLIAIYVPVI